MGNIAFSLQRLCDFPVLSFICNNFGFSSGFPAEISEKELFYHKRENKLGIRPLFSDNWL